MKDRGVGGPDQLSFSRAVRNARLSSNAFSRSERGTVGPTLKNSRGQVEALSPGVQFT